MKIVLRPALNPREEIDVTEALVAAIAAELARRCGGNDQLNWLEAERHLRCIVGGEAPGAESTGGPRRPGDRVVRHERRGAMRAAPVREVARG